MKLSHVLYKVSNLEDSVIEFQNRGFKVEFGSKNKPHNALIYFSEGPYIELLNKAPVPFYTHLILRLLGKGKVAERFKHWKSVKEGFFGLCLENHKTNFDKEQNILIKNGQNYFITNSNRTDPANRILKWKLLFPYELKLPFLMTRFNIDPKPKNFIHPNGVKKIKCISFGTDQNLIPIIKELCDDRTLKLFVGKDVKSVTYEKIKTADNNVYDVHS
jgi:hypothetical protein